MTKFYTISLPEKIIKKIDEKIEADGYTGRAEYVKEALRKHFTRGG